jgi:hypothetical protein
MKPASSRITRPNAFWRRVALPHAALVLTMCVAFVALIAAAIFWSWRPGIALSAKPSGSLGGMTLMKPADRFSETRVGQLLYWPEAGNECRRMLYDNRTGMLQEAESVACEQVPPHAEPPPSEGDRLTALRRAFQK